MPLTQRYKAEIGKLLIMIMMIPVMWLGLETGNRVRAQTATAPAGSGTSSDPYQIATLNNLYWVTKNSSSWDSNFIQTADINIAEDTTWDSGAGFSPIGSSGTPFTGTYDGNGYTIDSLHIDRNSANNVGLFGYTDGAVIKNLGLTNMKVTAIEFVGGIAGHAVDSTIISNSYSTGSVTGVTNSSDYVGGLIGDSDNGSTVSDCYSNASVSGILDVGGLAQA